ncbi:hypothetical protein [Streptomyces chrestomyceticus]|uniref:NurA domain-containing protein n=1 Tax=Streptomyces chrestomyceticus TaxID=68185 RepID=A0ABU7WW65_9ACTN
MAYQQINGRPERASRTSHAQAALRAAADRAVFHVPAEHIRDVDWLASRVVPRKGIARPAAVEHLSSVIAIDGSQMAVPVRDGLPSVRYGYIQAAAAYVDLDAVDAQRCERFVDPVALHAAVNTALVSLDLPTAGAYTREGISIQQSWREAVDCLFAAKRVEVNRLDQSLLDLLFLLHGTPAHPASTVPVNCPDGGCPSRRIPVGRRGVACPTCGMRLHPTDVLRLHDEVLEEGNNQAALGRLMQTVELLVLVGLSTLLWDQARTDLLPTTLFVLDGPLAMYGPSAKLRARALEYFQAMAATSPHGGPYVCGVEKTGPMADYARALARHGVLTPGDLLTVDEKVISVVTQADNPRAYGAETYWGRKFVYRSMDGRVLVITLPPPVGEPYDDHGGQPLPDAYPTLSVVLDVIDRTGSSLFRDGLVPIALAHGAAAYPIGVGTDVLRLVARRKLGIDVSATAERVRPRPHAS